MLCDTGGHLPFSLLLILRIGDGVALPQEALRIMASATDEGDAFSRDRAMPASLRQVLSERNILDLTEPYWSTNYTFTEAAAQLTCPIFRESFSVQRWLGLWCRYLLFKSRGPLSKYFSACRYGMREAAPGEW